MTFVLPIYCVLCAKQWLRFHCYLVLLYAQDMESYYLVMYLQLLAEKKITFENIPSKTPFEITFVAILVDL